ncbi:MAG TPA: hypothetical protein EYO84_05010 [Planctomycetes bacterium]|nr:hypothetical protein [Planctomycetota bacterium]
MRLTVSQLRRLVAKELDVMNEGEEIHFTAEKWPHVKIADKFFVAVKSHFRDGVDIWWSRDGRREGEPFHLESSNDQEALIKWLSELKLKLSPEEVEVEEEVEIEAVVDGPEDFPGDL